MKNIQHQLITLFLVFLAIPMLGYAQETSAETFTYEVSKVYPYLSVTKGELQEAQHLADLNRHYKPAWVREYISVEVLTCSHGVITTSVGTSDALTKEQKANMQAVDAGTDIAVKVRYLPENTLRDNDVKEIDFTFSVDPDSDAHFVAGEEELQKYLKEKAIDNIPSGTFQGYQLAAVKFTVTEQGEITNAHVFESSKDADVDALLLATIQNMPNWNPATYSDGTIIKQEFAFTVGNMESCVVNLLGIRRLAAEN